MDGDLWDYFLLRYPSHDAIEVEIPWVKGDKSIEQSFAESVY